MLTALPKYQGGHNPTFRLHQERESKQRGIAEEPAGRGTNTHQATGRRFRSHRSTKHRESPKGKPASLQSKETPSSEKRARTPAAMLPPPPVSLKSSQGSYLGYSAQKHLIRAAAGHTLLDPSWHLQHWSQAGGQHQHRQATYALQATSPSADLPPSGHQHLGRELAAYSLWTSVSLGQLAMKKPEPF